MKRNVKNIDTRFDWKMRERTKEKVGTHNIFPVIDFNLKFIKSDGDFIQI